MQETGIVRRIDELGRVVIPKEMRKTLRIREGDPLEIYTDKDHLVFKKYSPLSSVSSYAEAVADGIEELLDDPVMRATDCSMDIEIVEMDEEVDGKLVKLLDKPERK